MSRNSITSLIVIGLTVFVTACRGSKDDPPEEISKLRALGVVASKLTAGPSLSMPLDTVTLTVHAAAPKGTQIAVTTFVDEPGSIAIPVETVVIPGTEVYDTQYESLDLYSASVLLTIPPASVLKFPQGKRFVTLRYGIELAAGAESERIVGSLPIYQEGSPEITEWKPLAIDIVKPVSGGTFSNESEESLEGSITKNIEENVRVGWYVTGGLVKNRRAKNTSWETPAAKGKHLVILTARGLNTGAFAIKASQVTVE